MSLNKMLMDTFLILECCKTEHGTLHCCSMAAAAQTIPSKFIGSGYQAELASYNL